MTSRSFVRGGVLLLALMASAGHTFAQAVPLRYQWKQGDIVTYRTVVRTTSSAGYSPLRPAMRDRPETRSPLRSPN